MDSDPQDTRRCGTPCPRSLLPHVGLDGYPAAAELALLTAILQLCYRSHMAFELCRLYVCVIGRMLQAVQR